MSILSLGFVKAAFKAAERGSSMFEDAPRGSSMASDERGFTSSGLEVGDGEATAFGTTTVGFEASISGWLSNALSKLGRARSEA